MLFNSYAFVLFFLPVCLIGYFGLCHFGKYTLAQVFLLGMSFWFYGYFNPAYLPIMVGSIVVNYLFSRLIRRLRSGAAARLATVFAVLLNLGVLFFVKYFDFFVENLNALFKTDFAMKNILLPLGISFFTFQQISYIIDTWHGEVPDYPFLQYASFVAYFPQLIAGPIVTHDELIPQFECRTNKRFNWDHFARGIYIFVLGLAKKVLVADMFGNVANVGFGDISGLDSTNAIVVCLAYTMQIYFDFSGYCDMAIGIGKMMNIDLPVNFDSPYKSRTILEFWKRWHKTLTRFLTKYVYIPLGGNRRGKLRTYGNVFFTFLISGLWHGANWTFLLWGGLHGLFSVITRHWRSRFEKVPPVINWLLTFAFINVTWVFFRADSISDGLSMLGRIASLEFGPIRSEIVSVFRLIGLDTVFSFFLPASVLNTLQNVFLPAALAGALILVLRAPNAHEKMQRFQPGILSLIGIAILLVWCMTSFAGVSTFLYFNF